MKKIFCILMVFAVFSLKAQEEKVVIPSIVKIKFQEEFADANNTKWTTAYRGDDNQQIRYEATFFEKGSKLMVSYTREGVVDAIEERLAVQDLKQNIVKYIQNFYPTYKMVDASVIVKEGGKKYYNVGIGVTGEDFLTLIFDGNGNYLYKEPLDD